MGKRFPILGRRGFISWELAEEAYLEYAKRYRGQSLERLAERGGFAPEELDELRPGWRPVQRRIEELEKALGDAIELAEEGWGYAGNYFRDKWEYDDQVTEIRHVLEKDK